MAGMAWPSGAKVALSLTYDGSLAEHLDVVAPALAQHAMRGTFFLSPPRVLENVHAWQGLSEQGHEMGNGCLAGVTDGGRLPNWTLRMVEQDLHMTQEFLYDLFPDAEPRSFAYPGARPLCSQGNYRSKVDDAFSFARAALSGENDVRSNVKYLKSRNFEAANHARVETWRRKLLEQLDDSSVHATWQILKFGRMFEGRTNRALLIHELVVALLASQKDRIWIAPMGEVARVAASRIGVASAL